MGLLGIGVSGVRAHQEALNVTGHNITNANTEGYSRQRVEMDAQVGASATRRFEGAGVQTSGVTRIADEFAINQVRTDQALFSEMKTLAEQLGQIETMFFGDVESLDLAMTQFFDALHLANASPASIPDRQVVLNEAQALSERFNSVHARLQQQASGLRTVLDANVARANELALGVAELNERINSLQGVGSGGSLNTLLDERDVLLKELSELVSVKVVDQGNHQVNVFVGKGQPLVLGARAGSLEVNAGGDVLLRTDERARTDRITDALTGGIIGGLLRFREGALSQATNTVGSLAAAFVASVNEAHQSGLDLNGAFGDQIFRDLNSPDLARRRVIADTDNEGVQLANISVFLEEPLNLTDSDYELVFSEESAGSFFVRKTSDDSIVTQGVVQEGDVTELFFDGLRVELASAAFAPGDRYLLTPTKDLAGDVEVVLNDPAKLALASPVNLATAEDNTGNATLSLDRVFDFQHEFFSDETASLVPPLAIVFTTATTYDIMDASDPTDLAHLDPPLRGLSFTPGLQNQVLPDGGDTLVQMSGAATADLPNQATITTDTLALTNGYPSVAVDFHYTDPESGALLDVRNVAVNPDSSAKQIAGALSTLPGVTARAFTELSITGYNNDELGAPMEVVINGESFTNHLSLEELADAINTNDDLIAQGVLAKSDGQRLDLTSIHGDDITIHIGGDPTDRITVANHRGESLQMNGVTPGSYRGVTIGGQVTVQMSEGIAMSAQAPGLFAAQPVATAADFGFDMVLNGVPEQGDTFSVRFNGEGVTDNRNGLALAGLATLALVGEPNVTYSEAYANIVQTIGSAQSEANIQRDAARALLDQSIATRESISGVNLDEEAANLIRFEQAYNASAQVISVAREVFDILFDAVR